MSGETKHPPESPEPVAGAELCPKCLGLVLRDAGVCKHCGERVFPNSEPPPPSAGKDDVFRGRLLIFLIVLSSYGVADRFCEVIPMLSNGSRVTWKEWFDLACAIGLVVCWLLSWRSERSRKTK